MRKDWNEINEVPKFSGTKEVETPILLQTYTVCDLDRFKLLYDISSSFGIVQPSDSRIDGFY